MGRIVGATTRVAIRPVSGTAVSTDMNRALDFGDKALDRQRARFDRLKAGAEELRVLREKACALEVELIAAQAALKAAFTPDAQSPSPEKAAEIVAALDRTRRLEDALGKLEHRATAEGERASELARLEAGHDALRSWLEAPRAGRPPRLSPVIQGLLAGGALVALLATLTVHPVFLLLFLPLLLPFGYRTWSQQNAAWLRLGAERRYAATGLKPPARWEAALVSRRVSDLAQSIEVLTRPPERPGGHRDEGEEQTEADCVTSELLEATTLLEALLAEAGLAVEDIRGETEHRLRLAAQVHKARQALNGVQADHARLRSETDEGREAMFRFLSLHGQAPIDGRADLQTLDAGLNRLAADAKDPGASEGDRVAPIKKPR